MIADALLAVEQIYHELLWFGGFWLLVGAIDDLGIDLIWVGRRAYRRMIYYRVTPPLRASELPPATRPGLLAVFVPTWQETGVIGHMLAQCGAAWHNAGCDHRIYVGCYANDAEGIATVTAAAASNSSIRLVLVGHPGPTTKADCLNSLWQALVTDELASGVKAKAIVLHDAEDAVHAQELRIFDRLIEKSAAVQLPVIPIRTTTSPWISAHYCDEFAEAHGKFMVVREAVGASLPLAGVGCAIDRNLLGRIAFENNARPFDEGSLTEDYELGLRIGADGGRTIMARILDADGELVGTKAHFPETFEASVKQKARWLTGISLAGWDRLGWRGSLVEKWMLLHDRRSVLSAMVLVVAYICILLTAMLTVAVVLGIHRMAPLTPWLVTLLWINAGFLFWRIATRAAFVWAIYGPVQAVLSVPRGFVANMIAITAAHRACVAYVRHCFGRPLTWDKTAHHVIPATK